MGTVLISGARILIAINPGKGNISPPTTGWCTDSAGVPTDAQLAAASSHVLYLYQPPPLDDGLQEADLTLGYDQSTPTFLLDGVDFVSFNNLPAGFIFTSLNVSISLQLTSAVDGGGVSSNPGSLTFGVDPILPNTTFNGIFDYPNPALDHSWNEDLIPTGFSITPNEFITWQPFLGGTVNTNRGVAPSSLNIIVGLLFEGTYEIQRFQFSIDTESPVESGQEIVLSSNPLEENPLIFDDVTEVTINYKTKDGMEHTVTITQFTFQGPNGLTFILPDIEDAPEIEIVVTIDGTQFSGSVSLGILLTIFFINGTGIYRISPGKTNDTLYVQDYDPVETVDVKIPNPFFKTGFLPDV